MANFNKLFCCTCKAALDDEEAFEFLESSSRMRAVFYVCAQCNAGVQICTKLAAIGEGIKTVVADELELETDFEDDMMEDMDDLSFGSVYDFDSDIDFDDESDIEVDVEDLSSPLPLLEEVASPLPLLEEVVPPLPTPLPDVDLSAMWTESPMMQSIMIMYGQQADDITRQLDQMLERMSECEYYDVDIL
ncbi:hypothetical protein KR222_000267 [Zaprionus bogoriensis]|nr:hypothetical protein KR222_000267 [Zaprionus bogoriensis]